MPSIFKYSQQLQTEYSGLFETCVIRPQKLQEVNDIVSRILEKRNLYEVVGNKLNIPWYFIAIVHFMKCKLNFRVHLHNGDPLTVRTIRSPAGRPKTGNPPFTWEASAEDALICDEINEWSDWSVPGMLFKLEGYDGYGYHRVRPPINSPYLWGGSNHYTSGKFTGDGVYSPAAVSKQLGAAVLLKSMAEQQIF